MKKIVLGLFALTLTVGAMAQATEKKEHWKHENGREFGQRGEGMFEKLNLTDAQKAQVKQINENFKTRMSAFKSDATSTPEELKEKRQSLIKEHRQQLLAVLTPEQRKQAESFKAEFKDKRGDFSEREGAGFGRFREITKDLGLTADQNAKITSIETNMRNELKAVEQNSSLSIDAKKAQKKDIFKKYREEFKSVLTEEQKDKLKSKIKDRREKSDK